MLIPVKNACVRDTDYDNNGENAVWGRVSNTFIDDGQQFWVMLQTPQGKTHRCPLHRIGNGLKAGMSVYMQQQNGKEADWGIGTVLQCRIIGGCEQVLAEFPENGKKLWLPYQNLRLVKDAKQRFATADFGNEKNGERFRLKILAHALEMWNENTGALSDLEIDPLPHQIHLVHHILSSGNLNWLIADDVGLGKTIETGMLLYALQQRGRLNRVLLVAPAGLTRQWQEELHDKFNLGKFQIYGEDFHINEARHWKMYDFVIASMDKLKDEIQLEMLASAGRWDLVVFDEAHRLSRYQYGMKFQSSDRFKLARFLRGQTEAMLLLSATPHQGKSDKFQALLELLRPERTEKIRLLEHHPELLRDMVCRNNKADVTDVEGNFIFKGKTVHAVPIPTSDEFRQFDAELQDYFRQAYCGNNPSDIYTRAVGFVMTTYRKLAASSIAAIDTALRRRMDKLETMTAPHFDNAESDIGNEDERFGGEDEEKQLALLEEQGEFFHGEKQHLQKLLQLSGNLKQNDAKLYALLDNILPQIHAEHPQEKLLLFTEYKTTQEYLKHHLEQRYGIGRVGAIHGSMPHSARRQVIREFDSGNILFLLSTEAGGEGINLQRNCHIMINYDLPWNPMRLVQRIGRLYRYGQQNKVHIFNLHTQDTADEQVVQMMYQRIHQVVSDMAKVNNEFNERLYDDIFGEFTELADIGDILNRSEPINWKRTTDEIEAALIRAKDAVSRQRELFAYAAGFHSSETAGGLKLSVEHWQAFVSGMFVVLDIPFTTLHKGKVWDIELPESICKALKRRKNRLRVTTDRLSAKLASNIEILDINHPLMILMLQTAKSYKFGGLSALISHAGDCPAIACFMLRWQDGLGRRVLQTLNIVGIDHFGKICRNPNGFTEWLKRPFTGQSMAVPNKTYLQTACRLWEQEAEKQLAEYQGECLFPENKQWLAMAWNNPL
ncbi:helicase-related protein [Neisseria sp. 23W00296]|uniref:helicase-related protein n=1 Tax=unclassified Neisseria TaxID=2623750 RepID=UPI0037579CDE